MALSFHGRCAVSIASAYLPFCCKIVAQISHQYTLGYTSTNTARDGRWRKVEIRMTRPDLRSARVQSRKGYFALLQN